MIEINYIDFVDIGIQSWVWFILLCVFSLAIIFLNFYTISYGMWFWEWIREMLPWS